MGSGLTGEFEGLALGDHRLNVRARKTLKAFAAKPSVGAPAVLTSAELEGYYRFVNNERVTLDALLKCHTEATVRRASELSRVVIAHDTTDFRFSEETARKGLGPMDNGGQGFYAHFSLAVAGNRQALGVVALETWTREPQGPTKPTQKERYENPEKEPLRWMRAILEAERVFAVEGLPRLIHVLDREADDYDILCELVQSGRIFIVRGSYDRRLVTEGGPLKTFARALEVRCEREAKLSSRRKTRPAKQKKTHPPRTARTAMLSFAAGTLTLRRPDRSTAPLAELTLNVVHVRELSPPPGYEPVEWFLLTCEPIETDEQILQIVDDYRSRWVVEEYFKALKTGCAYEQRQHETKTALLNALGIFIPIAWSLLNMRNLSRDEVASKRPAKDILNPTQLKILRLESKGKLSKQPTVGEAVLLMARVFGGLQPSNGLPGWHILGRAFEKLLTMELGWRLATERLAKGDGSRRTRSPSSPEKR